MINFLKKILALLKAFVTYCPYCLLGKKAVQVASGKKIKKESKPTERERKLMEGMKTGRNIAIIGVFCPFFWVSLLTGSSIEMIRFNAIHSGVFILIGIIIMLVCRVGLGNARKENSSVLKMDIK